MSDDTRDGLDARIDRVLREQTTPRPDPAFRARVVARIEDPADVWSAWTPRARRMAVAVAGLAACVVLAFFIRVAPEPRVSHSTRGAVTPAVSTPAGNVAAPPPQTASTEIVPVAGATVGRAAGSRLGGDSGGASARSVGSQARRAAVRVAGAGASARALLPPPESTVSPALTPVDVSEVVVERIEVRPLASTAPFAALGEPEPLDVEPVSVGPIGGR